MKNYIFSWLITLTLLGSACSESQSQSNSLKADDFSEKIKQSQSGLVLDVRTPEEFAKGHLETAKNIDWKNSSFIAKVEQIDKSKPVFVYCLSGIRSAAAAKKMREIGFTQVYELDGGMVKWRAANLPETTDNARETPGMNAQQFEALLDSDKPVLVNFYAEWCEPCKRMAPYMKEITNDMKDKVKVVRINADDNKELCKALKVEAIPVLQVYKNKNLSWSHEGFIEKADLLKHLN